MTIKMRYENGRALPLYNPFNPKLMSQLPTVSLSNVPATKVYALN